MIRSCRCRIAQRDELSKAIARSGASSVYELILKPRFRSAENFLVAMNDARKLVAFSIGTDDEGALLGWACCFRFHERLGYAGVVEFVMDVREEPGEDAIGSQLYRLCAIECRKLGMHTIIGFAHSRMPNLVHWYHANGFVACGAIDLDQSEKLHVFYRKLRHDQIG